MLERVTALLAQAAATILVVIGLVAILGYTHSRAYRAGYCAVQYCPDAREQDSGSRWWPFGGERQDSQSPARSVSPGGSSGMTSDHVPLGSRSPDDGYSTTDGQIRYPDPPPGTNGPGSGRTAGYQGSGSYSNRASDGYSSGYSGSSGRLPLSRGVAGPGSTSGRGYRPPVYSFDPGNRICSPQSYDVEDADVARCWLNIGDAYQAVARIDDAREAWDEALLVGSSIGGAQASLVAHRRLQAAILERSCPTTQASLARIAYGFSQSEDDGDIIDLDLRQRALSALGYYTGEVDGAYGPMTRRSVRDFQGDMGFDQTGALTPSETVTLVCHAALTARDTYAQNLLGIMFATGLGLEQNIDTALEWLEAAAERGHGGANFNLALMYGTGTVQGSYRLCGIVESPERADSYLRRAADLGHARALALRRFAGTSGPPAERWRRISERLLAEAERTGDRFYLAWQRRVDEIRRAHGQELDQPGCYRAAMDGSAAPADGDSGTTP
ncbi:peptidoglycan-binding protein [Maricaulis sp.]|uniref:peptidoglycan-binding protein n=1 Tax=Maricaulis sp. TaxID=1486257 RepID=UPI0026129687|nr:peptidoglycan-binding protein [Maricaulis sp.]